MPGAGITITVPFGTEPDWRFGTQPENFNPDRVERFVAALLREIQQRSKIFRKETFTTVYFGGCGPSNLTLDQLYRILEVLYDTLTIQPEEQTLILLPGTVDSARAKVLRESGFDQMTIRVQKPTPLSLAQEAFNILRKTGFFSVGWEIIAPASTEEVKQFHLLEPDHIIFIPQSNTSHPPEIKQLLNCYQEYLPSHFARPGKENHHLIALTGNTTIAGFGPGAFSRKNGKITPNPASFTEYLKTV